MDISYIRRAILAVIESIFEVILILTLTPQESREEGTKNLKYGQFHTHKP